jgi:membrane-associated phospholipid phosphatase
VVDWRWFVVVAAGLAVLGLSIAGARRPTIPKAEARVFHAVNGLPDWLFFVLWLPMQLGNLVVGTLAGLAVALLERHLLVAAGVVVAAAAKLVVERVIRHRMGDALAVRQRPSTSEVGARRRGSDVPVSGPSFPSGHVMLVAAIACVITPIMPPEWAWVPHVCTLLVMLGRVYVAAHNPLDVTAGLGAGVVVGATVAAFVH